VFGRIFAIDVSENMLKVAVEMPASQGIGFALGNALAIPLPDSSVDLVFTSCVFHHVPRRALVPVLQECQRVTKRGGYVMCFEHNPLNPITQLVVRTTMIDRGSHLIPHWRMASALREAELEVIMARFVLFAPEPIDRVLSKLGKWLYRVPLGGQYLVVGRRA
jgi:ubiquinone/menaquinone biosynthesis C-methylase UbiE